MNEEDKILVESYHNGDNLALEKIINKYLPVVYNYIYRLISSDEADDLVQDVFVKVWRNLKRFDIGKASLKTWILVIARNTVIDYFKKRKATPFSLIESEDLIAEKIIDRNLSAEEIVLEREKMEDLDKALTLIPVKYREVLVLHYQEDLGFREIAEILGKPLNTIKSYHYRAILKLRDILQEMHQN